MCFSHRNCELFVILLEELSMLVKAGKLWYFIEYRNYPAGVVFPPPRLKGSFFHESGFAPLLLRPLFLRGY